jgi:hypothetical protein
VFSKDGLLDALKKALAEGILDAERGHHLAGERAQARAETAQSPQLAQPLAGGDG